MSAPPSPERVMRSHEVFTFLTMELGRVYLAMDSKASITQKAKVIEFFKTSVHRVSSQLISEHLNKMKSVAESLTWAFLGMVCYRISFGEAVVYISQKPNHN